MNRAIVITLLFLASSPAAAAGLVFKSGDHPARLLEVFSSEGCSSCPPAEAWVSGLKPQDGLWKSVVPIVWHVDYWDRLGWRDPFGSRNNSIRQKSEASAV